MSISTLTPSAPYDLAELRRGLVNSWMELDWIEGVKLSASYHLDLELEADNQVPETAADIMHIETIRALDALADGERRAQTVIAVTGRGTFRKKSQGIFLKEVREEVSSFGLHTSCSDPGHLFMVLQFSGTSDETRTRLERKLRRLGIPAYRRGDTEYTDIQITDPNPPTES